MKTINIIDIMDIAWNPTGHNCLALLYGQTWTMMGRIDDGKRPRPPFQETGVKWALTRVELGVSGPTRR
jgi:hypothetical protein